MAIAATEQNSPNVQSPSCYDKMIDRISQEKGISKEEAKVRLEAKLKEIAQKKGITVEELKKRMAEGKCCKGHGKMDEAKLKEIAEKKGITVEELKQRIEEHHSNKEKALQ
ncbi:MULTISPECIES: hypothetical protein [Dehalobacter]|uniref:Uncharacterized protein n=1 Tax=Dehalobacter restrictus (strain DSM 9455 / PER-K23) TaxID=871738 RepID=A0ABN4BPT3_DEHRP|nr:MULTISPECIES: hypothetical protein [Dehalobacter]AHF09329.1 hypothetical protein DEHRE_03890 [Dehalobacter restrictus DSM 9455]MDJ0305798.1 hypothetical protein [Dehalobacter sp.]